MILFYLFFSVLISPPQRFFAKVFYSFQEKKSGARKRKAEKTFLLAGERWFNKCTRI
jgi:hypothetical protein